MILQYMTLVVSGLAQQEREGRQVQKEEDLCDFFYIFVIKVNFLVRVL